MKTECHRRASNSRGSVIKNSASVYNDFAISPSTEFRTNCNFILISNLDCRGKQKQTFRKSFTIFLCVQIFELVMVIGVPLVNTRRLQPTRHRIKHLMLTICETGEIVLEYVKYKPRFREERIVDVCRISSDGQTVMVFQPGAANGSGVKIVNDAPIEVSSSASHEIFTYSTLPQKHWKKYTYAARFVDVVRRKTPKVTCYSARAKCTLMESGTDYEMQFYGDHSQSNSIAKIVVQTTREDNDLKLTDRYGATEIVTESQLAIRRPDIYKQYATCLQHTRNAEQKLMELEAILAGACFPAIIGRRRLPQPQLNKTKAMPSYTISTASTSNTRRPGGSTELETVPENNQVSYKMIPGASVVCKLASGAIQVDYMDGSKLVVERSSALSGKVTFTPNCRSGQQNAHNIVKQRLVKLLPIMDQLEAATDVMTHPIMMGHT